MNVYVKIRMRISVTDRSCTWIMYPLDTHSIIIVKTLSELDLLRRVGDDFIEEYVSIARSYKRQTTQAYSLPFFIISSETFMKTYRSKVNRLDSTTTIMFLHCCTIFVSKANQLEDERHLWRPQSTRNDVDELKNT